MKNRFEGHTPPQESKEQPIANFKITPGRVFDGETSGFFIRSKNAELDSAARSLRGEEALDFYTNSMLNGRSESEMKQAAESLRDKLNDPEIQQLIMELAKKKRQLEQQIKEIEDQCSELLEK